MKWRHKQGYYISWFFLYQQLCWLRLFFSATKWISIDDSSNMKLMTSQCSMRSEWRHFHTLVTIENSYCTDAYKPYLLKRAPERLLLKKFWYCYVGTNPNKANWIFLFNLSKYIFAIFLSFITILDVLKSLLFSWLILKSIE